MADGAKGLFTALRCCGNAIIHSYWLRYASLAFYEILGPADSNCLLSQHPYLGLFRIRRGRDADGVVRDITARAGEEVASFWGARRDAVQSIVGLTDTSVPQLQHVNARVATF